MATNTQKHGPVQDHHCDVSWQRALDKSPGGTLPNSDQDEDIGGNQNEKCSQGDETTIGSNHKLQSVSICAGKPNKSRKITANCPLAGATEW